MKKVGLLIGFLLLAYCTWGELFGPIVFDVETRNTSSAELADVKISFERFYFQFGILTKDARAIYSQQIGPWPKFVKVSWVQPANPENIFSKELMLANPLDIQTNESLELVVEFKDGGPVAYPRARGDESTGWRYRYKD